MTGNRRITSFLLSILLCNVVSRATEYVVPAGDDVSAFFAKLPKDATYVSFSAAAEYHAKGDIILPRQQYLVIDGKGCRLSLGAGSNGFTTPITDQKMAAQRTGDRYTIRDFAMITGGRKAIDLQATLNSTVINCRLTGQTEAAVDLRFCLMARLENVLVTNPVERGFVVRCGDWPGANTSNSQSNHTVLSQCRVYCSKTTTEAFTVLNSGGVRMTDCISEGSPADYDLFLSARTDGNEAAAANNPVVKAFTLSNFHVEHRLRKASIHVNMPPKSTVNIDNVYWNSPIGAPVIHYVGGQLNVSNIGWWNPDFRITTSTPVPHINFDACHKALVIPDKPDDTGKRCGALQLVGDHVPGRKLDPTYVRITRRAM
ncbi:MAG: hypothetical protein KF797_01245 [Flavobacteriales bacterium]|nr:hypothetical protein [Flavobacteriales bacterium]